MYNNFWQDLFNFANSGHVLMNYDRNFIDVSMIGLTFLALWRVAEGKRQKIQTKTSLKAAKIHFGKFKIHFDHLKLKNHAFMPPFKPNNHFKSLKLYRSKPIFFKLDNKHKILRYKTKQMIIMPITKII